MIGSGIFTSLFGMVSGWAHTTVYDVLGDCQRSSVTLRGEADGSFTNCQPPRLCTLLHRAHTTLCHPPTPHNHRLLMPPRPATTASLHPHLALRHSASLQGYFWDTHMFAYYTLVSVAAGLFQSTGWPSVVSIVANWSGKGKRGLIMGIWNAHTSVGNILGTVIAAAMLSEVGRAETGVG